MSKIPKVPPIFGRVPWNTSQIEMILLSIGTPCTIPTIDGVHKLSNCEYRNYFGDFFFLCKIHVCIGEKNFFDFDGCLAGWHRQLLTMEAHSIKKISEVENSIIVFCYQNCSDLLWEKSSNSRPSASNFKSFS